MQQNKEDKVIDAICSRFINAQGRVTEATMKDEATALIRAVEMVEQAAGQTKLPLNATFTPDASDISAAKQRDTITTALRDVADIWLDQAKDINAESRPFNRTYSSLRAKCYTDCANQLLRLADQIQPQAQD